MVTNKKGSKNWTWAAQENFGVSDLRMLQTLAAPDYLS